MHVVFSTDRPEFPLGEEAGQRDRSHSLLDCFGIVIGLRKQAGSTTVTAEEQRRLRWHRIRRLILFQELNQILVSRVRVTNVELHCLTNAHQIPNRDRPVVGSRPDYVGNQKVSPCEGVLILIHHDPQVKSAL